MGTKLPKMGLLLLALTVEKLSRSHTRSVLEHPCEVLGVFKTYLFGHLVDALAA